MKKYVKRLLAVTIVIVMMSGMLSFNTGAVSTNNVIDLTDPANATYAFIEWDFNSSTNTYTINNNVRIIGDRTATATLTLSIPAAVTVQWEAKYRGTASPLVDLSGSGSFVVESGGLIENTSTSSYSAVRANAPAVTGPGIAITVRTGGIVKAGLGTAIEGAGAGTRVSVTGGTVSNSATNNLRPVINMTYDITPAFTPPTVPPAPDVNVTVSGGEVYADVSGATAYGYGIQTYGSVTVSGGKVFTHGGYGRAINIVGVSSKATVSGGEVYATSSGGVAISSATTAGVDVTYTSVEVSGGLVYANAGMAIRTTGKNSTIAVSGGLVIAYGTAIAGNNNVIFAQNNTAAGFTGVTASGVAIAWNQAALRRDYDDGTTMHLSVLPANATAVWAKNPSGTGYDGITYTPFGGTATFTSLGVNLLNFSRVFVHQTSWIVDLDEYEFPYAQATHSSFTPPRGFTVQAPRTFSITNTGTDPINLTDIVLALDTGSAFEITSISVATPYSLAPANAITVSVQPKAGALQSPAPGAYPVPETYIDTLRIIGDGAIADLTVKLSFTVYPMHRVHASGYNGDALPYQPYTLSQVDSGYTYVKHGDSITFMMVPGTRSHLNYVMVGRTGTATNNLGAINLYTFDNVTSDCAIFANFFAPVPGTGWFITAFAGAGGIISDPGTHHVQPGSGMDFVITASDGYMVSDVRVDTRSELTALTNTVTDMSGNLKSGTFSFIGISRSSVITATFERSLYCIDVVHNQGGSVSLEDIDDVLRDSGGQVWVHSGDNVTFEINVDAGYRISSARIGGVSVPASMYPYIQIPNIDRDLVVEVQFTRAGEVESDPEPPPPRKADNDVSRWLNTTDHMRYIQGVGNNLFEPDRHMTRAEASQLFFNLLNNKNVMITTGFPDVQGEAWYMRAVSSLASIGFIKGYPDGNFRPDGKITRAEFVTMTIQFAERAPQESKPLPFADVSVGHWAYRNIDIAVQYGWVIGYGDGSFAPEDYITRAEVVTLVNRMLDRVADREYIDSHTRFTRFTDVQGSYWQFYGIMEAFHAHNYRRVGDAERWY